MAEVSQQIFLGNDEVFGFYDNKWTGINSYEQAGVVPAAWSFRTDAFSASLNFATPGTLITDLGMTYAWSDVSADIRGVGSNLSVLTANLTSSATFNNFSADGYTESSQVSSTGRFRSSDDTEFEFGAGNFTIECWYNAAADTTPSRFIFSDYLIYNLAQSQMWFDTAAGRVRVVLVGGGSETLNQSSILTWVADQWYHLALVRNGTTFTVYRDGTSVLSFTRSVTLNSTNQGKFLMGYYASGGDTTYIQDYRIYKGIAKYTSSFTPPDSMAVYE
jgi:hypothetical protein